MKNYESLVRAFLARAVNNQLLRIMRLTTFLLLIGFMHLSAASWSQTVTLNAENQSLRQIFELIEKQTGYWVVYSDQLISQSKPITVTAKNMALPHFLDKVLESQSLTYTIDEKNILIMSSVEQPASRKSKLQKSANTISTSLQQRAIRGKVTDEDGNPLQSVTVSVKGTQNVLFTNENGNYETNVQGNNVVLVFTSVGYANNEQVVGNRLTIDVVMVESLRDLDEVVVVGYGSVKKKDVTGAVSSIKFDDSPVSTVSTVGHILSGAAAGLEVNTLSAQPGGGISINIRGAASIGAKNDPLIVIDGFPVASSGEPGSGNRYDGGPKDYILGSLNPNDIESIEILKDASSTAIYGARAGHGVIIITTKRGKKGIPQLKYSGTYTAHQLKNNYQLLNAQDYMIVSNQYLREQFLISNKIGPYGNRTLDDFPGIDIPVQYSQKEIANPLYNTKWIDAITRVGQQHQHNLSLNGGNDMTQYQASLNYFNQGGIIDNNSMQRVSGRINLDQKVTDKIKIGTSILINHNSFNNLPLGTGANEYAGVIRAATQFSPLYPIMNEKGEYSISSIRPFIPNPVSLLEITDKSYDERLLAIYYTEFNPIEELNFKLNLGIDRKFRKRSAYIPKSTLYGKNANGEASLNQYDNRDYLIDLTATYTKSFGLSNLTGMVGHSFQQFNGEGLNLGNKDFLTDSYLYNNIGAGDFSKPTVGSWNEMNGIASFFGRANYSYNDRYLLTLTMRADGASNFAKGNQWGYFPSIALGWRFTEESFMNSFKDVFSNGKIRFSSGETGNSSIGNGALDYYSPSSRYIFNDEARGSVRVGQIGNKSLTWETTREFNIGLDLSLYNKVNITAEVYSKEIVDLLTRRNLMSYYFVSSIADNIGTTQSKGLELTVNTTNIHTNDFNWSSTFTYSLYRDRWKERVGTWIPASFEKANDPIRSAFGYKTDGLIKEGEKVDHMPGALPGMIKIRDINSFARDNAGNILYDDNGRAIKTGNSDGKIDEADKEYLGTWDPKFRLGFANSFRLKKWDLSFFIYGAFNMLRGATYMDSGSMGGGYILADHNFPVSMKDVWRADNPNGKFPGYTQSNNPYGTGDYFMKSISYARVRNITLGYNLPFKKGISNLRCYLDVNNPILITNYTGIDPEMSSMDDVSYPTTRSFSFGLDITF